MLPRARNSLKHFIAAASCPAVPCGMSSPLAARCIFANAAGAPPPTIQSKHGLGLCLKYV
ncbi:hypothetical protein PR001_g29798 [Phytophthora rubi]|uniref:Uncharacterized protein n=1 Tax=Phytophthora rubi TaxID=129364 RepID=A0A6A3GZN6_9STRA|nr:hypothetical protein PR001_g29798 [Phytophthora rubi]